MIMRIALAVIILAVIFIGAPCAAPAQSVLEMFAGIKFCKTLTDDTQRLKCFDGLFTEKQSAEKKDTAESKEREWTFVEEKSPVDDSPEISATILTEDGQGSFVFRCKEHRTEAAFLPSFAFFLSGDPVRVMVRIGEGKPINTTWHPSTNNRAIFAPSAIEFLRSLGDGQKLFLRVTPRNGNQVDGLFNLGKVSAVREKIAEICKWPDAKKPK
jgi:hypothetical protein